MTRPVISVDTEFDMMADYQLAIESKSVIIENALEDDHRYSLYSILEPVPTYDEYMNGNEFEEDELLAESNTKEELLVLQKGRRG
jgi:hypothetical protein